MARGEGPVDVSRDDPTVIIQPHQPREAKPHIGIRARAAATSWMTAVERYDHEKFNDQYYL